MDASDEAAAPRLERSAAGGQPPAFSQGEGVVVLRGAAQRLPAHGMAAQGVGQRYPEEDIPWSRDYLIILGQQGFKYSIRPLTPQLAQKFKDMAVLTTLLGSLRPPKPFGECAANRAAMLAMPDKYHDV